MKLNEMRSKIGELVDSNKTMIETGETENRELSTEEMTSLEDNQTEIRNLEKKIEILEEQNKINERMLAPEENKIENIKMEKKNTFNLYDAMEGRSHGSFTLNERDLDFGTEGDVVGIEKVNTLESPLMPELLIDKLGAKRITGRDNQRIPVADKMASTLGFNTETGNAEPQTLTYRNMNFVDHYIRPEIIMSKAFVEKDRVGATAEALKQVREYIAEFIESSMFTGAARNAGVNPGGLYNASITTNVDYTSTKALDYANLLDEHSALATANVKMGNTKMASSFSEFYKMKGQPLDAGSGLFVLANEDRLSNLGTPVMGSSLMASDDTALIGDFSQLVYWVATDDIKVTFDPYTLAGSGQVRYVFDIAVDWQVIHSEAIRSIINVA